MLGMPTGIVTGASRGLGLELARALDERGWRLVVDARGGEALEEATARAARRHRHRRRRRRSRSTGRRSSRPPATGSTCIVNNASLLGPEPAAAARRLSARDAARGLRGERDRAAGAGAARAAAHAASGAAVARHHLRRRASSPTRAGAATAPRRPRSSSSPRSSRAEHPGLRVYCGRPRRHAHPDAPGRLPGRGHLRPPAARGERARPARPDRGLAAERPLPGRASSPQVAR